MIGKRGFGLYASSCRQLSRGPPLLAVVLGVAWRQLGPALGSHSAHSEYQTSMSLGWPVRALVLPSLRRTYTVAVHTLETVEQYCIYYKTTENAL